MDPMHGLSVAVHIFHSQSTLFAALSCFQAQHSLTDGCLLEHWDLQKPVVATFLLV